MRELQLLQKYLEIWIYVILKQHSIHPQMNSSLKFIYILPKNTPIKHSTNHKFINLYLSQPDTNQNTHLIDQILQKHQITKKTKQLTQNIKYSHISVKQMLSISSQHINIASVKILKNDLQNIEVKTNDNSSIKVPWFPKNLSDINLIGKTIYQEQNLQNQDHPQFTDPVYRKRRNQITQIAQNYKIQTQIPTIDYTQKEHNLWKGIIKNLRPLHKKYFCSRFQHNFNQLNNLFKIERKIPQLAELSNYLQSRTGFRIKPVHGIVSQRQFLNALAFKVFFSTQYLRHHSTPEYTPQPDIVHEIVGHVPMFADNEMAELSQKIGQISLGASDEEIKKLGAVYFFTIEFGVCRQRGENRIYGAGFASCIKQIMNFSSDKARFKRLDAERDCNDKVITQGLQQVYYVTECFESALRQVKQYGDKVPKQIKTTYDPIKRQINCNRNIQRFKS